MTASEDRYEMAADCRPQSQPDPGTAFIQRRPTEERSRGCEMACSARTILSYMSTQQNVFTEGFVLTSAIDEVRAYAWCWPAKPGEPVMARAVSTASLAAADARALMDAGFFAPRRVVPGNPNGGVAQRGQQRRRCVAVLQATRPANRRRVRAPDVSEHRPLFGGEGAPPPASALTFEPTRRATA